MIKKILLAFALVLIVIQFVHPAKNNSNNQSNHINTIYPVPQEVSNTLAVACADCHSNNTRYPWYSKIQPVAWWLDDHVKEGKKHFNFSEFANRRIAYQNHKMEELIEMVDKGEMPLNSYTWVHGDARLTAEQKQQLTGWAKGIMDTLKARYPADSLVMPKRPSNTPPAK